MSGRDWGMLGIGFFVGFMAMSALGDRFLYSLGKSQWECTDSALIDSKAVCTRYDLKEGGVR